jgi:hypothetical protein
MPPKKAKKTKAELEEERLQKEEEDRKAKILEDKRLAEEAERNRIEQIRIKGERKVYREAEVARLADEERACRELVLDRRNASLAEERDEVGCSTVF